MGIRKQIVLSKQETLNAHETDTLNGTGESAQNHKWKEWVQFASHDFIFIIKHRAPEKFIKKSDKNGHGS